MKFFHFCVMYRTAVSRSTSRIVAHRYRLVRKIGQGKMGRVWVATDELLDREVALKEVLLPANLSDAERQAMRERAMREARAIAQLAHPNVVRFFDVVLDDDLPWIVMEYVQAPSLHELIRRDGPLPPEQVAHIGTALLGALKAVHEVGIVHRDVKPSNVLIAASGRVVLTDFGLVSLAGDSELTGSDVVVGSPSFMAPEQALDGVIGPASDLWSLGATLYLAVEGRPPYLGNSPVSTLAALAIEPPRTPRRAGGLLPTLQALLEKDPTARIDAGEAERLLRSAAKEPAIAPRAEAVEHDRWLRWGISAAVVLGIGLISLAVGKPEDLRTDSGSVPSVGSPPVVLRAPTLPSVPSSAAVTPPASPPWSSTAPMAEHVTGRSAAAAGQIPKPARPTPTAESTQFTTVVYRAEANHHYVSAEDAGASPLLAYPAAAGPWETFDEIDLGGGEVALRAEVNDKYVTASPSGGAALIARSDHVTAAETFVLVFNADGTVSLRSKATSRYVSVPSRAESPLTASRSSISKTEKFTRSVLGRHG
ncbi:protein kinase [Actinoplanes sp. NPDC049596]|uniref:protein kinase domain-containing protein n=1 Tax=unclassified Actinoplanes TaxID=2626549 RepID=UPI003416F76E